MNAKHASRFETIGLEDLEQVQLMERTDKKFLVPVTMLPSILQEIELHYFILEINAKRLQQYHTHYFDTADDLLYSNHHNGKLNRYKVRKRTYVDTQASFLEVKQKTNKGKTIKQRLPIEENHPALNEQEKEFIRRVSPINPDKLLPKSANQFQRLTLADKQLTERCTIDFNLQVKSDSRIVTLEEFAIIEVKQDRFSRSSMLTNCLFENRIKPMGFSKYCIGRVLVEDNIKKNTFKPKIRTLTKLIQN
ncbi:polyphosphate polymerase domain-containing protein [Sunxiuqinia sp. sy24]|uniref:polyphosphate polymerase domain-containing protein n=1 Tax=Sunxiuqinia sp. sy24 TaxID=3461495 RepID=UPI0040457E57